MLNKQGPGKISWTDFTWNPVQGVCKHGCPYCYMKRFWRLSGNPEPILKSKYLLDTFPKKPSKIFVGSSTDMFGKWIDTRWIQTVLNIAKNHSNHIFQFLTKNPARYGEFHTTENAWYGTTVDGTKRTKKNIEKIIGSTGLFQTRFVSFEPLLKKVDPDLVGINWVIIGADSNQGAKNPLKEWADLIINRARDKNIPIFIKDNYGYPKTIKEFPNKKDG